MPTAVRSASKAEDLPSNWREPLRFIRYHYLKLFKMMIVGFVAFTMLDYITPGPHQYRYARHRGDAGHV